MDLMSLTARDLSNKCLEAFRICLTFHSMNPGLSNQHAPHDERFEYRLADFNLWIDGIGALAPSKASLDARLSERPIDLSLVKGNLVMLFQSLEDCLILLKDNESPKDTLLDIDSALESLVTLSLAIRRTGRRSRLHKADRLFKPEEHAELRKHLEAIIILRPGPGTCSQDDEFQAKMKSLTPIQSHLVTANLKRRNRFIQAQLHSLGLKKRSVGFELLSPETAEQDTASAPSPENRTGEIHMPAPAPTPQPPNRPLPALMSATSASVPESKLQYKEPVSKRTESTPMTAITQITASARYPRPRISDNEQKVVQCPCCCQTLPVSEAKNNNRWRKHLAEDIRPYTCIFDRCPAPDAYYSSRSMLEQHFRQDHPPVWVCPLCDHGSVYPTMTEMMDHLHDTHAQDIGEDISSIISSSAQTRMGIEGCPLCEVKGCADSSELIDHVLEHVHDFSLRSLPWPKSSEVDVGGEVGSFKGESDEAFSVTQWLEGYEHETEDIDPTLKLSTCDYGRLVIITEQIESQNEDKLGFDIGFADEHGDESAEAETDISQLTQDTIHSVKQPDGNRNIIYCISCAAEWYKDEKGLRCPECESELVSVLVAENDRRDSNLQPPSSTGSRLSRTDLSGVGEDGGPSRNAPASKPSAGESASGFRKFADRLFSRKKTDDIEPQDDQKVAKIIRQFPGLSQAAYRILAKLYQQRLGSPIKKRTTFELFINHVQDEVLELRHDVVSDLGSFLEIIVSFYMEPLRPLPPKDLTKPISNYFINTSHRALLHETSKSRTPSNSIRKALLAGYRSVDIDVWESDVRSMDDFVVLYKPSTTTKALTKLVGTAREATTSSSRAPEIPRVPIVTDNWNLMKPFGFREACQVIRESAFINSDLPVIVNISVHTSPTQQESMVRIMKEEWQALLVDKPLEDCDPRFQLPRLKDLQDRILVTLSAATRSFPPSPGETNTVLPSEGDRNQQYVSIIQPLAELEVYMRSEPFEGFKALRTKSPSHVFSLSEGRLQDLISALQTRTDLLQHNRNYFFRANPNSVRADTSNLEPLKFWRQGVQMVAVSRHNVDEGMMLNEGMFADESGWVLKPDSLRKANKDVSTDLEGALRKHIELSMFVFQGQDFQSSTNRKIKDLSSLMKATLYVDNEEHNFNPKNHPISTDIDSGALGYMVIWRVNKKVASIIPKLSILR
ncbi:hypothetical protein ACKLNR_015064 [Fusarium oxysporum f. sp. zingiberi]